MFAWLRRAMRAPTGFNDPQTAWVARQLYVLSMILLQSAIVAWIGYLMITPWRLPGLSISFLIVPVLAGTIVLLKLRRVRAACLLLVIGMWVMLLATALLNGGIRAPAYHGLLVVTLCAGMLLGRRAALICAFASVIAGLIIAVAEDRGLITPLQLGGSALSPWIAYAVYLIAATALLSLATSSISASLQDAQRRLAERLETERLLRERDGQLRIALDAAQMATWNWDIAEGSLRWAGPISALLGIPPEQIGESFEALIERFHPDDQTQMRDQLRAVLDGTRQEYQIEARIAHPDGNIRWFALHGRAYFGIDGRPVRMDGVLTDASPRKQIEQALRLSEGRLRSLLAALPDLVLVHSPDTRYCDVYTGNPNLLATSPDRMLGHKPSEIFEPEFAGRVEQLVARVFETGQNQELEYQIRLNGEQHWFQARLAPFQSDGEPRVICLARDISVLKRIEEQVRVREELYRQAVTAASAVPYYRDYASDSYGFIGSGISGITGYTAEEFSPGQLIRLQQLMIMRNDLAHLTPEEAIRLTRAGQVDEWHADILINTRDGDQRWISDSAVQMFDERGHVIGSFGILQDITDRKRTEQALQESEERFRLLAEAGFEGIGVVEGDRLIDANTRLSSMTGYPLDELPGRSVADLIAPESRTQVLHHIRTDRATPIIHQARRKDGTTFPAETQARRLPTGRRSLQVIAMRDVSERLGLEAQLRQAQKLQAVGQLAGGLSHDFNNLLTIINSYAALVSERVQSDGLPDWLQHDLDQIRHAGHRAATLTRQLLAFSRRQVLNLQVLDLNEIVIALQPMLQRLLGATIELRTRLAQTPLPVRADAGQIEQVIINLTVNARDAMAHGGVLTIESMRLHQSEMPPNRPAEIEAGEYIILTVSDTGAGMTEEVRAHIFEPFFTTKAPGQGTGLGLATAHGIIKQSNGHIWFTSDVDRGTTFTICLPCTATEPAAAAREPQDSPVQHGSEAILLVEDDHAVRRLTRTILERQGYQVIEAQADQAEQLCISHHGPIDLLLTDVMMPEMDGGELARRLTRLRPELRVLFMSGYTDNIAIHLGALAGDAAFLQKPFTPSLLIKKVRSVLDS